MSRRPALEQAALTASPTPAEWPARSGPMSQESLFTSPDIQLEGEVTSWNPAQNPWYAPFSFFLPFQGFCFSLRLEGTEAHTHP